MPEHTSANGALSQPLDPGGQQLQYIIGVFWPIDDTVDKDRLNKIKDIALFAL